MLHAYIHTHIYIYLYWHAKEASQNIYMVQASVPILVIRNVFWSTILNKTVNLFQISTQCLVFFIVNARYFIFRFKYRIVNYNWGGYAKLSL